MPQLTKIAITKHLDIEMKASGFITKELKKI